MIRSQMLGFSLIELSVVLVLLSLATALVVPNLSRAYTSFQLRGEIDEMKIRLERTRFTAFERGEPYSVTTSEEAIDLLQPPAGWDLGVITPVRISPQGVCYGGEIVVSKESATRRFLITPPHCRIRNEN